MGKKDSTTKLLTRNNDVFAELFNRFVFEDNVVDPDKLVEKDSTEITAVLDKMLIEQKYRDVLKRAEIKVDSHFAYLLLGLENQSEINYAMPVRTMLYDAINYSNQISEISKEFRKGNKKGYNKAEWMSGFPKGTLIKPVITLVLCWSPDRWDAPKSLHEMMDSSIVNRYKDIIDDYKLHLISVHDLSDDVLKSLTTEIGLALEFSKYSRDEQKMYEFMNDDRFKERSNEFVATINEMNATRFKLNKKGGMVNMCKGIEDMKKTAKKELSIEYLEKLSNYFESTGLSRDESEEKAKTILLSGSKEIKFS
ncbi:MAG: hypothetical protein IJI66_17095 [Erysipelotrichaceae bacterium]|nr:hypothetical protein [Erysipelotrichaceae bacterium]